MRDSVGYLYAGECWYLASEQLLSCDTVCAGVGTACDEAATRDIAGSGGTYGACSALATALYAPPDIGDDLAHSAEGCGFANLGLGCTVTTDDGLNVVMQRWIDPVTTCADDGIGLICEIRTFRICACDD